MARGNVGVSIADEPTNGGAGAIAEGLPYRIAVTIEGASVLLFHRWNVEAVEAKAGARKNSAAKKSDDTESYLYRDPEGVISMPGEYLRQAIIGAARYRQDPRSPRKSAMDLYRAGVVTLTNLAPMSWGGAPIERPHFEDKRRVVVQRAGINRTRPAFYEGWEATFDLLVLLPEYIAPADLSEVLTTAGRLIGVGDFRPSYGRFFVRQFTVSSED